MNEKSVDVEKIWQSNNTKDKEAIRDIRKIYINNTF